MGKKILILRFSSIGDIVLTTPVVRCLKNQLPGCSIHYLTKSAYAPILENNPYIDQLHLLNTSAWAKGIALRKENFDLIIDLHHNLRSAIIKKAMGVKAYSFPKLNIEKFLLVYFKVNKMPNKHIVDRYLSTLLPLGIENDDEGLDYFIPQKDRITDWNGFKPGSVAFYTWAIGAQHFTKRLPNHKIIERAKQLVHPVVLLGGPEDRANGDLIAAALGASCINLCGQLNINQSAFLVSKSMKLFSNDTGLMHIGAAFKIPIVSFWGNTTPTFGMSPYYGKYVVANTLVENTNISCRPCSKIGHHACPKKHFQCMETL